MGTAISSFPSINPLAVMLLFVFIPPTIMAVVIKQIWKNYHWRGDFLHKLVSNFGVVLNHHAPLVTIVNLFLGILLFLNQGAYVLNHYSTTSDIKYYLRVDRPEFVNYNLIFNAQALNSIEAIRLQTAVNLESTRRLAVTTDATSDPTDQLNFIYHRDDWGDVTSEDQLVSICKTERDIFANLPCLENKYDYVYKSFISKYMNTTSCAFKTSYLDARAQVGYFPNARYFSDRTMYSSAYSPILISYFRMGSCADVYDVNEFIGAINAHADGDTVVVPASFEYLSQDMKVAIADLKNVMLYSTLFAFIFLVFSVRGVVVAVATLFCIALAMVNGAAMLDQFGYETFSVFNTTSLLVLLSVGAGFVHLYGAAWRRTVKRGKNASPQCLMVIFGTVGKGNLLTFLACCLAFFALGTAPVLFISQMGYFIGISMFVFFVSFHYIIVPLWVWTSWYTIPSKYHNHWRIFRQRYFFWMLSKHQDVVHHHHHHHHGAGGGGSDRAAVLGAHGHSADEQDDAMVHSSDEDEDDESSQSSASVVAAVVAPDQVRYASEVEGRAAQVEAVRATAMDDEDEGGAYDEHGNFIEHHDLQPEGEGDHHEASGAVVASGNTTNGAVVPRGAGTVTTAPAGTVAVASGEGDESGGGGFRALCSGKRPVKLLGFFMVLLTLFLILLSAIQSQQIMITNFAYARLLNKGTNLATVMQVFQYFRGDIFYAVDDDNSATITLPYRGSFAPTMVPTARPTVAGNPTPVPTARPTVSAKPTPAPSSRPTPAPTAVPTRAAGDTAYVYTDFRITGCWGLSPDKDAYDSGVGPHFGYYSFRDYMEKNGDGLLGDMDSVCDYVDTNRDFLMVHPDWNRTRDCISNQVNDVYNSNFFQVYNKSRTVANTLIFWGTRYETAPTMVGLYSNETGLDTIPVWVCANFTGRSYLTTFHDDMPFGIKMRERWEDAFYKHGSANAKASDIPIVVGSTEFTFPLLGLFITAQIQYQAIVFILGFPILLLIFTSFDFGLTFFGVLGLFTIYLLTIFLCLNQVSTTLNLGDVVVLIIVLPYMVCFNIHLITAYMSNRTLTMRKTGRAEPDIQFLSPTLVKTQRYMIKALTGPLILAILASIAFTGSMFPMLRRFGRYYIICAIVAYLFCVIVQPFLLAFSCKSSVCTFEYVEDAEPAPPAPAATSTSASSVELVPRGNATTRSAPGARPDQRRPSRTTAPANNPGMARPGSQFAMNSVYNNTSQFQMSNDARGVELRDARPVPAAATRSAATRSVASAPRSNAGSVVSHAELFEGSDSDEDYGEAYVPAGLPANAVRVGTSQYVAMHTPQSAPVGYGSPQPMGMAYSSPQPAPMGVAYSQQPVMHQSMYGYDAGEYHQQPPPPMMTPQPVDEYGRPLQYAQSPPPPMPMQPAGGVVRAYRRVGSNMGPPMYPPAGPQQTPSYYSATEDDATDAGSVAYSQSGTEYESSEHRRAFLPPGGRPGYPAQAGSGPAPSFYSNGRGRGMGPGPRPYPQPPASSQYQQHPPQNMRPPPGYGAPPPQYAPRGQPQPYPPQYAPQGSPQQYPPQYAPQGQQAQYAPQYPPQYPPQGQQQQYY